MSTMKPKGTSEVNGPLWGARAHDWFRALQGRARQPAIHQALAASLTGVGVGWLLLGWALPPPATVFGGTESGDGRVIALGKVKVGTPLADALAKGSVGSDDGLGTTRLIAVADVDDKFGNPCREIEVFSSGDRKQPSAVVVACRHPGADEWVVVGASATTLPRDAAQRNYASSEAEALESVSGILSMIGARRRTTAREVESKTR